MDLGGHPHVWKSSNFCKEGWTTGSMFLGCSVGIGAWGVWTLTFWSSLSQRVWIFSHPTGVGFLFCCLHLPLAFVPSSVKLYQIYHCQTSLYETLRWQTYPFPPPSNLNSPDWSLPSPTISILSLPLKISLVWRSPWCFFDAFMAGVGLWKCSLSNLSMSNLSLLNLSLSSLALLTVSDLSFSSLFTNQGIRSNGLLPLLDTVERLVGWRVFSGWGHGGYGQLGLGHTETIGDDANEMGDNLSTVAGWWWLEHFIYDFPLVLGME